MPVPAPCRAAPVPTPPCRARRQTFVQQQACECGPLLELLLRPSAGVGCPTERLAEHFTPTAAEPDTYVRLYSSVVRAGRERAELSCLLLDRVSAESVDKVGRWVSDTVFLLLCIVEYSNELVYILMDLYSFLPDNS